MSDSFDIVLPPSRNGAHIGFFGGSFDPPHLGHTMLCLSFLALEPIDELWIVPCYDHAFKEELSPFSDRLRMCQLAFNRLHDVKIVDIEQHLPSPNYTIQTIKTIMNIRPDIKLFVGLGSDIIAGFERWHRAQELSSLGQFVIFERENYRETPVPDLLKNARTHTGYALPDINSTKLREQLQKKSEEVHAPSLDRAVADYIREHNLYR